MKELNSNSIELHQINTIVNKYDNFFNGIGEIKITPYKLELKNGYEAAVIPSRRVL